MSRNGVTNRVLANLSGHLGTKAVNVVEAITNYVDGVALISNPPSGKCKVTNIYVDPVTGKTVIEYENVPVL